MPSEPESFQGSRHLGVLPTGCLQCRQGAKLVLFLTGVCPSDCFYCPVSEAKIDHDVAFANERALDLGNGWLIGLFEEARATGAWGTGITGGDPLARPDRILEACRALKVEFGREHHIHLYTQQFARADLIASMKEAGLDEWRLHPHEWLWATFGETPYARMIRDARNVGLDVGVEVPCTPDREEDLKALIVQARAAGAMFVNLNELEYSEVNAGKLRVRGYDLVGDEDNRVAGSMETGYRIIQWARETMPGYTVHFCSSRFKDGTQLTKRLGRRAERTAKPYMETTEDNTVVFGVLSGPESALTSAYERLITEYEVPVEWVGLRGGPRGRIEIAPWVLEEVFEDFLDFDPALVEEYPTEDRLEVERIPLAQNRPATLPAPDE